MLLLCFLRRDGFAPDLSAVAVAMIRSVVFALLAAFPACFRLEITQQIDRFFAPGAEFITLLVLGILFGIIYLGLSWLAKAPEPGEFIGSIISRKSRNKEC